MRRYVADTAFKRLKGMLFSELPEEDDELLLTPCNSVHSFGMKFPIDLAFIDKQGKVLLSKRCFLKNQIITCLTAYAVIERKHVATLPWYEPGEQVIN